VEHAHPQGFNLGRQQGARGDHPNFGGAENVEGVNQRAGHPRMQDVADDGDLQVGKIRFVATDGEHVQHGLGGMGVTAVAGVEHGDMRFDMAGDEFGRAALLVAHHEHVALHRFDILQGIQQAFALDR
jgi:hypothetical protein